MKHINLIEALTQVIAGTVLIFISNACVFYFLSIEITFNTNATLVGINTIVAFVKSYYVRAFFRKLTHDTSGTI